MNNMNGGTRTKDKPEGSGEVLREEIGNVLVENSVRLAKAQVRAGNFFSLENPASSFGAASRLITRTKLHPRSPDEVLEVLGPGLAPLEVPLALSPAQRCELRLVSTRRGGKLEVELRAQGEEHAPFQLRVARGDGPWEPPEHIRVHYSHGSMICDHLDSGCWTSTRTFEPGALRLRAYDSEGRTVERRVLVRAGEITRATFDFSDG